METKGERDRGRTATETRDNSHLSCPLVGKSLVKDRSYHLHVSLSPSTGFGGLKGVFSIAAGNKMRQFKLSLSQDEEEVS